MDGRALFGNPGLTSFFVQIVLEKPGLQRAPKIIRYTIGHFFTRRQKTSLPVILTFVVSP